MKVLILFFLVASIFSSEIIYVRTQKAKVFNSQTFLELEVTLEEYDQQTKTYSSYLQLPTSEWIPRKGSIFNIRIPSLKETQAKARITQCQNLSCGLKIDYPYRGFEKISSFISLKYSGDSLVQIPIESIISSDGENHFVYIEENNLVYKKKICLIQVNGIFGLTHDISSSKNLVVSGLDRLVNGQRVEVIND